MPIHHALWRVGRHPERLTGSQLGEKQLEEMIVDQPPYERLTRERIQMTNGSRLHCRS